MPISYRVDHDARIVVVVGHGVLADAEVFGYQHELGSRSDIAGYGELIDMSAVTEFAVPSADRVRDLADLASAMDGPAYTSRLAIVAPADIAFGLGRMYQAYRELGRQSVKEMGVFRTMEEALAFLRVDRPPTLPGPS